MTESTPEPTQPSSPLTGESYMRQLLMNSRQALSIDFVRNVAGTMGTRLAILAIGAVTGIIVTNILGPERRGLVALAVSFAAVVTQLSNLGLHTANVYFVGKNRDQLGQLAGNSLLVGMVGTSMLAVSILAVFLLRPDLAPAPLLLLAIALLAAPFEMTNMLVQQLFLGLNRIFTYNKLQLAFQIVNAVIIVLLIATDAVRPATVIIAIVASQALALMWALFDLRGVLSDRLRVSLKLLRASLGYGMRAYMAALFMFLVLKVDILMVGYMLDETQAGLYSVAVMLGDMFYMLPVVIGSILFPTLTGIQDGTHRWRQARRVAWIVGALMVGLSVPALLLGELAVVVLFGEEFAASASAFRWLVPAIVLLSVNVVLMNYLAAIGMPMVTVFSPLAAMLANVAANVVVIPWLGINGAAISSIWAYGMMLIASIVYITYDNRRRGRANG